jgi:hypothetical protein
MSREIVAVKIGTLITTNMEDVRRMLRDDSHIRLLSRQEVRFMSACDLGVNWDKLAESRTICIENGDGTFCPPPLVDADKE